MSKGSDVVHHIVKETSPNVLPASPVWQTIRWTSSSLKKTVELGESEEVIDSPFEQGSAAVSATASGDIGFEFTALSQDMFLEGVARNVFVEDDGTSVLNVGGPEDLATYTIVKHDKNLNMIEVFTGCRINQLTISASTGAKITGTASIIATGYSTPTSTPVTNPAAAPNTPFVAGKNITSLKVLSAETAGSACIDTFEITINNGLEAVQCLGSGSILATRVKNEAPIAIGLTATALLTNASKTWIPYVESRQIMTASIDIQDNVGNKYVFSFPSLELDNDGASDLSGRTERTLSLEFKNTKQAITVTKTMA